MKIGRFAVHAMASGVLLLCACGSPSSSEDKPSSVTFQIRNSYNGCSRIEDGFCLYVNCSGYNQQHCFPDDNTCVRQWTFTNVPAKTCTFNGGYAAQYKVPGGKNCSLFFERISGGGYYGIQPQWIDYGLNCD